MPESDPERGIGREQVLSVVWSLLLVTATTSGMMVLGSTPAAAAEPTLQEGFEDGDTTVSENNWSGWNVAAGSLQANETDLINGSYAGEVTSSSETAKMDITHSSSATPSRVGMKIHIPEEGTGNYVNMRVMSGSTEVAAVSLDTNNNEATVWSSGETVGDVQIAAGETYSVEFTNINYSAETFTLKVNGEDLGEYSFSGSASSIDTLQYRHGTEGCGCTRTSYIDDVQIGGDAFPVTFKNGALIDDFEDDDLFADHTDWEGWYGDTGALSTETESPINGSVSGKLTASDSIEKVYIQPESAGSQTPDYLETKIRISNNTVSGDDGGSDEVDISIAKGTGGGSNIIGRLRFDDSTDKVTVNPGQQNTTIRDSWSAGTEYTIAFGNISWSEQRFTVYINGKKEGRFDFRADASALELFSVRNDIRNSSTTRSVYFDDVREGPGDAPSNTGTSGGGEVNGTVVDQNGDPVANATVVGWGVDYSNISAGQAQSLEDRARELIQESTNLRPKSFDPELQLAGTDGKLSKTGERYVAVHTAGDWALRGVDPGGGFTPTLGTNPELGSPLVRAPANEKLILTAWDPTKTGLVQDGADGDLPGSTVPESTTIIVEQIGPSNSTIGEEMRLETQPYAEITSVSNPTGKTHHAAKVELPTGFYRVQVEGSSFSYVIAVGDTKQMVQAIQSDLTSKADTLSNRAQEIRDKLDKGKFTTYRTTTNADGEYNFSTGSNVKTVAIQAHKTPPGMATDPQNATLEDIRTYYATTDYNGSMVLPSEVKTVDAPSSNNTVRVREYSAPSYPDLNRFKNATEQFEGFLKNLTYSELPSQFHQPAVDVTREQWKTSYETLRNLVEGRPEVEERAQELLGSDEELFIDSSEATTAELR